MAERNRLTASDRQREQGGDLWPMIKTIGFWVFLLVACFIFGMMIVSPLITAAGGSPQPAAQSPASPAFRGGEPSTVAPRRERRRAAQPARRSEPGIEVAPQSRAVTPDTQLASSPEPDRAPRPRDRIPAPPADGHGAATSPTPAGQPPAHRELTVQEAEPIDPH